MLFSNIVRVGLCKKVFTKLKCKVCTKHNLRKHFSSKWIEEVDSIQIELVTSEVIRINADQHIHVMEIEKTELRANHIVLTIYHKELATYVHLWMA